MSTLTIHEGTSQATGITTKTHFEDDAIIIEKSFDAEPYLQYAERARQETDGLRWGNGRIIGTIPPAFHSHILTIRDPDERKRAIRDFFAGHPRFVMFHRYGK